MRSRPTTRTWPRAPFTPGSCGSSKRRGACWRRPKHPGAADMAFWCHILVSGEGTTDAPDSASPLAEDREVGMIEAFTDTLLRQLCGKDYQQPDYTSLPA